MSTYRKKIEEISKDLVSPYRGQKYTVSKKNNYFDENVILKFLVIYLAIVFIVFLTILSS